MDYHARDGLTWNCLMNGFFVTLLYAPPSRPFLLLMDGHSSHYCPEVIREAAAQKVVIFVLQPTTTHCTQPLDKGTFSALKVAWRQKCHDIICSNPGKTVSRYDFSKLFSSAWYEAMTMVNITSGFKVTGVCPFDRNAFKLPGETFTSFRPQTIQEEIGLAYIPMYSPRRFTTKPCMQVSPDPLFKTPLVDCHCLNRFLLYRNISILPWLQVQ